VRIASVAVLIACLVACKSASQSQNTDAVRQAVNEYLMQRGFNLKAMDVSLSNLKFNGNQADVTVGFGVKGQGQMAMSRGYHLEQQNGKWVVVGSQGGDEHGKAAPDAGGAMPGGAGAENPHAGGVPTTPPGAGGKMPSPEDLPPAGKKK
jgi:hypothetical protein